MGNINYQKTYVCSGHYHNVTNHLMVNPFTMEVMPDQWCQGNMKPVIPTNKEATAYADKRAMSREDWWKHYNFFLAEQARLATEVKPERVKRMSEALWCKIGGHAFDPDDEGAEEFTRTVKVKDRYGELRNEVKAFSVCSEHLSTPFQAKAINGQKVEDA